MEEDDPKSSCDISSEYYRLYFKGLINEETTTVLAGFGVAICDKENNLLFQMKGPLHGSAITDLEAELMALRRGLTEAVRLGITHISVYCDYQTIFELVRFFFFAVEGSHVFTSIVICVYIYLYCLEKKQYLFSVL